MSLFVLFSGVLAEPARAQKAPDYQECRLDAVFPAGGRRGETVTVELLGTNGGLAGVRSVLIDGPPGITVRDVKNVTASAVQATFVLSGDAAPGRRSVRVLSERTGLTNMVYFTVGRLPEGLEKEPNNEPSAAQPVGLPIVVNGRVNPKADVDCYRFSLRKGQRLVGAVLAHAFDSHGQGPNYGIADARLELLDESGRVVAEAGDTLGLDPQIEYVVPRDGTYTARVQLEGFAGFPQAVYRLFVGEVGLATSLFPPGGRRGEAVSVEFEGPNLPAGTRRLVKVPTDDSPSGHLTPDSDLVADLDLPFVHGDLPERNESEPNQAAAQATPLALPMTVNARIDTPGDADWYRLRLSAGQKVRLETTAQRFLRSSLDTLLEVYDAAGKRLAENDDGFAIDYVSMHDYRPMDSRLVFTAPAAGEYLVRVSDQSGAGGPRAVYRLTATVAEPDFELYLYPDGVPVWGPGSTAALLVKVVRFDGMEDDVALEVEGLPSGWKTSKGVNHGKSSKPPQDPARYHFLTVTAPPDAKVGDTSAFHVVGRTLANGKSVERRAAPLTLYYTSDIGFFRISPLARVAVARPQSPWLDASPATFTVSPGGTVSLPVTVHGADKLDRIDLTANLAGNGVATSLDVPQTVPLQEGRAVLPLKVGTQLRPGRYDVTVSLRWRSDIRVGMPGPCTPLLSLQVVAPTAGK